MEWDEDKRKFLCRLVESYEGDWNKIHSIFLKVYPNYERSVRALMIYHTKYINDSLNIRGKGQPINNYLYGFRGNKNHKRDLEIKYLRLYTPRQLLALDRRKSNRTYETKIMKDYIYENFNS